MVTNKLVNRRTERLLALHENISLHTHFASRASEVGLVTLLRAGVSGILIPAERKDFSLLKNIQKASGVHSSSNLNGTRGVFPGNEAVVA
jgi:hypothetical protein